MGFAKAQPILPDWNIRNDHKTSAAPTTVLLVANDPLL
jgi:hypothetical protein